MKKLSVFECIQGPAEYVHAAQFQRKLAREIADKLERGEPLDGMANESRVFAALILRQWADNLSDKPKGKQGSPPRFDACAAAITYAVGRTFKGKAHGVVIAEIADRVGVSETAVAKRIEKYRASAFEFIGRPDPGNQ